jgi:hypothetical protein
MFDVFPVVLGIVFLVIALAFIALPVVVVGRILRARSRLRAWTPTTATLLRVSQSMRGRGNSRHAALVGHYEYRDQMGATHPGTGDLGDQGMPVGSARPTVQVVYDPLDPTRSMVANPAGGAVGCLVAMLVIFGLVGLVMLAAAAATVLATNDRDPLLPSDSVTEWQAPR